MEKPDAVPRRLFGRSLQKKKSENLPPTVPIIGLGCSSFSTFFWNKEMQQQHSSQKFTAETLQKNHPVVQGWIATIHDAILECGITLLDTAPWYGHGTSEIVVGWALQELLADSGNPRIQRKDICVNTKIGRYEADPSRQFDFSRLTTLASVERSLRRLGGGAPNVIQYIDVLQLHDPEFSPTLEMLLKETIPALMDCRSKGWCKALGLTGYPLEIQYQVFQATLEKYGTKTATSIWDQALTYCHFNLHDSSLVHRRISCGSNNDSESFPSFADFCRHHNMGLLAAAPLSMGLLTHGPIAEWHPALGSELEQACRKAAAICEANSIDIATLALLYAMSHPSIPCTILGMKDLQQVNAAAELARRFHVVDWRNPELTQGDVLKQVLTKDEIIVLEILCDKQNGPFAGLDAMEAVHAVPLYQWDGVEEAHKFWRAIDGAQFEQWQWRKLPLDDLHHSA